MTAARDIDAGDRTYTAIVIGAGAAGLTVAIGLAGFGHDVALVEADRVGGDCTNVGCIPSKTLIHAARVGLDDPLGHVRRRRDDLAAQEDHDLATHDRVDLIRGWATLTGERDPHLVRVDEDGRHTRRLQAEHVVLATGSKPVSIDLPGLDPSRILTNETLFELPMPPESLVIVGGGAIAIEMATAFSALGTRVHVVEREDRLLSSEDPIVTTVIESALRSSGVQLHLGTTVDRADERAGTIHLEDGTTIDDIDRVLMALGRRPTTTGLGLDVAGAEHTPDGIDADDWGRTSVPGIWAVGDATGNTYTTHGANAIGRRVVRAIALPRLPKLGRVGSIPTAVYGDPEIASVGIPRQHLEALPASGRHRVVVRFDDIDRSITDDIASGVLVVDVERFTGRILRAAITGPGATDMIGMFTMAIDHRIGLRKLFAMVHPYPSHAEVIRCAADEFARTTYSSLPSEWLGMLRGRICRLAHR